MAAEQHAERQANQADDRQKELRQKGEKMGDRQEGLRQKGEEIAQRTERQTEGMINAYAQTQQRVLDSWVGVMQSFQAYSPDDDKFRELTERPLQVWEQQTKRLLDTQLKGILNAQAQWTQYWLRGLNPWNRLPTFIDVWARQSQQMVEQHAQTSQQIVDRCIEAGRRIDVNRVADSWDSILRRSVEGWEESCNKVMEAQLITMQKIEDLQDETLDQEEQRQAGEQRQGRQQDEQRQAPRARKSA